MGQLGRARAEQAAHGKAAVDGNAGHGAILLHGERVDAASAEAPGLGEVCRDPCGIVVYPGGEGKQDKAGEMVIGAVGEVGSASPAGSTAPVWPQAHLYAQGDRLLRLDLQSLRFTWHLVSPGSEPFLSWRTMSWMLCSYSAMLL